MTEQALPGLEENTPPAGPFIESLLHDGLVACDRMFQTSLPREELEQATTNAEVEALWSSWHRDLYAFLYASTLAHVLIRIEENYPNLAAGLAKELKEYIDAGDVYNEAIWEWADNRGLDPDRVIAEAREKRETWLAASPRKPTERREPARSTTAN